MDHGLYLKFYTETIKTPPEFKKPDYKRARSLGGQGKLAKP